MKRLSQPVCLPPKAQWVPNLLEAPAHTHIDYVVTDLEGGPKPPAPVEDSYRRNTLTVSRCVLWCWMQPCKTFWKFPLFFSSHKLFFHFANHIRVQCAIFSLI